MHLLVPWGFKRASSQAAWLEGLSLGADTQSLSDALNESPTNLLERVPWQSGVVFGQGLTRGRRSTQPPLETPSDEFVESWAFGYLMSAIAVCNSLQTPVVPPGVLEAPFLEGYQSFSGAEVKDVLVRGFPALQTTMIVLDGDSSPHIAFVEPSVEPSSSKALVAFKLEHRCLFVFGWGPFVVDLDLRFYIEYAPLNGALVQLGGKWTELRRHPEISGRDPWAAQKATWARETVVTVDSAVKWLCEDLSFGYKEVPGEEKGKRAGRLFLKARGNRAGSWEIGFEAGINQGAFKAKYTPTAPMVLDILPTSPPTFARVPNMFAPQVNDQLRFGLAFELTLSVDRKKLDALNKKYFDIWPQEEEASVAMLLLGLVLGGTVLAVSLEAAAGSEAAAATATAAVRGFRSIKDAVGPTYSWLKSVEMGMPYGKVALP